MRWSGATARSRSSQGTVVTDSSGSPRRARTVTWGPSWPAGNWSSTELIASFTSESTWSESHWPTSSGPLTAATSTAKR